MIEIIDREYEDAILTVKDNRSLDEPIYIGMRRADEEDMICLGLTEQQAEDIVSEILSLLGKKGEQ